MSAETNITQYIALMVEKPLNEETRGVWFQNARDYLPYGVMTTVQVDGENGGRMAVPMVCKVSKSLHRYYIPLTRHLTEDEAEIVVVTFGDRTPGLEFDVMVSKNLAELEPEPETIKIEAEKYDAICRAFAKRQHEQWVRDRMDAGWRYDTRMSQSEKTHPMLKPWDDLPESLRQIDFKQPQEMVNLLNDQGYAVVSQEELAGIYKLLRRTP